MEKIFNRIYIGIIIFVLLILTVCLTCTQKTEKQENMENNVSNVLPSKGMQSLPQLEITNRQSLLCENFSKMYTYDDLMQDLKAIANQYPMYVKVEKLCTTCDNRSIVDVVISESQATKSIFINGGTHANEYISSQLVMNQLINFLDALQNNEKYNDVLVKDLISDVEIHVVPMVNPDGITLCQKGLDGIKNATVADTIKKIAKSDGGEISSEYFHKWKANAEGVDINRNYPSNWTTYNERLRPSNRFYKGPAVASTREAKAMMDLTFKEKFVRAISYHTQGQVIYCVKNNSFAKLMSDTTGYSIKVLNLTIEPAYSDWTERDLSMKSVTVELGLGSNPLPQSQLNDMWKENQYVWFAALLDLQKNGV